jgi:tRNA threonylcarbamoyladenosine biosynthesis protein TsaE
VDEHDTESLGEVVGAAAGAGDVIELRGELGAGKTCWVRGFARGLGITEPVRSPTFTICHVHRGPVILFHLDAYRVEHAEELLEQGFDEMPARGAVAIEWGERVAPLLPADRLVVEIEHAEGARTVRLRALGPRSERLIAAAGAESAQGRVRGRVQGSDREPATGAAGRARAKERGGARGRGNGAETEEKR